MSILSRLFGGGGSAKPSPDVEPEIYEGFSIYAEPVKEGGVFRVAARIEKEVDGAVRSHRMVRADTCDSAEAARDVTTRKAKSLIDQVGDKIFVD